RSWCILPAVMSIFVAGVVLELWSILLLLRNNLWRVYARLFTYIVWLLIGNSAILIAFLYFPATYPSLYWHSDSVDVVFRFFVVWEVFHQTFPKSSGLNK